MVRGSPFVLAWWRFCFSGSPVFRGPTATQSAGLHNGFFARRCSVQATPFPDLYSHILTSVYWYLLFIFTFTRESFLQSKLHSFSS